MTLERPFGLDPERVLDVGPGGRPRPPDAPPPLWLSVRHRVILGMFALGALLVGGLAGATVAAFASGARGMAAVLALLTVAASPVMALGALQDWWRFRRRR